MKNFSEKKQKIIVVMPAYNAEKTVETSYRKLPKNNIDEIILIDDASTDATYEIAKKLPIIVFKNSFNLGYGGNVKVCLTKALEHGADIIIEYHPDNQYDPKSLPLFIDKALNGYDFALGSRFIHSKEALHNKMPLIKFIANRMLSFIDEFILGIELSEFHSGFRMYTRKMLTTISYLQDSDNYLFSFEVIVQAIYKNLKIAEVPIACQYHKDMHTANIYHSTIYAIGTFKTLLQYIISKFLRKPIGPFKTVKSIACTFCSQYVTKKEAEVEDAVSKEHFSIYFCTLCRLGYTYPTPNDLSKYYPSSYYLSVKSFFYTLLQFRRPKIIRSYKSSGKILDIGCGDGKMGDQLSEYDYTGIETSFSNVKNRKVKLVGVEGMNEKLASYDIISFWESFEHIKNPSQIVNKCYKLLKKDGILIIECPNFSSKERLIFGSRWFHLDPPRHIVHFTPHGLRNLLEKQRFQVIAQNQLYAPEYIPIGLAQSVLYFFSPKLHVVAQKNYLKRLLVAILLLALLPLTIPLSFILYIFNASPIVLTVAQKKAEV